MQLFHMRNTTVDKISQTLAILSIMNSVMSQTGSNIFAEPPYTHHSSGEFLCWCFLCATIKFEEQVYLNISASQFNQQLSVASTTHTHIPYARSAGVVAKRTLYMRGASRRWMSPLTQTLPTKVFIGLRSSERSMRKVSICTRSC